jgi:hypothetical protein
VGSKKSRTLSIHAQFATQDNHPGRQAEAARGDRRETGRAHTCCGGTAGDTQGTSQPSHATHTLTIDIVTSLSLTTHPPPITTTISREDVSSPGGYTTRTRGVMAGVAGVE